MQYNIDAMIFGRLIKLCRTVICATPQCWWRSLARYRCNLDLSRPLWVWLWIESDFVNPGIWAAFLCVHHCPFWHTYGIYPHYPQKTSLATTSNDELGQEDDKIALPCVEEVRLAVHFRFSLLEGASLLMRRLGQVQDTLQVPWQALVTMSLPAIRKSKIPPNYWVAIHRAIDQTHCCNPLCLPTLTGTMLASIYEPSMLQKHPAKCTSPPGSSDVLVPPQSTPDQWGVHSLLVSRRVVFHWRVSILLTTWSCMASDSESSGALHAVELLHL